MLSVFPVISRNSLEVAILTQDAVNPVMAVPIISAPVMVCPDAPTKLALTVEIAPPTFTNVPALSPVAVMEMVDARKSLPVTMREPTAVI